MTITNTTATHNAAGGFVVKTNVGFLTGNRNNPGETTQATHPQYVKVWRSRAQAQKWIDRHVDAGYGLNSDTAEVVPHAEVGCTSG
jgi:hypothetical protein